MLHDVDDDDEVSFIFSLFDNVFLFNTAQADSHHTENKCFSNDFNLSPLASLNIVTSMLAMPEFPLDCVAQIESSWQ